MDKQEGLIPKHGSYRNLKSFQAKDFENKGGFTERLYRLRKTKRR